MPSDRKAAPAKEIKLRPSLKSFWAAWLIFTISLMAALAPGALIEVSMAFVPQVSDFLGPDPKQAQNWVLLIGAITAFGVFSRYIVYPLLANRYFITHDSVVEVYGIIKKERKSTKFEHILTVNEDIGYIGRLLGFGDIVFFTAGSGGEDIRLNAIDNPGEVAFQIQERADKATDNNRSQHNTEIVEAVSRHGTQIDRLIKRLDDLAEQNSKMRAELAVLTYRIDDATRKSPAVMMSSHDIPTSDAEPSGTQVVSADTTGPSVSPEYKEDLTKLFPPENEPSSHLLNDRTPTSINTAMAPSKPRRQYENPRHDDDGNLSLPNQTRRFVDEEFPEEEVTGLMMRGDRT